MSPATAKRLARAADIAEVVEFNPETAPSQGEVLGVSTGSDTEPADTGFMQIVVDFSLLAPSPFYKRGPVDHEIEELASSLHDHGFINVPTVRMPSAQTCRDYPDALYEIETGHRRVAAVRRLHRLEGTQEYSAASKVSKLIPVTLIIGDDLMRDRALLSLAENTNRKSLTSYEEAMLIGMHHSFLRNRVPSASLALLAKRLNLPKSRVVEGVKISQVITEAVLREAGFVLNDGSLDHGKIARLKKEALASAARAPSQRLRIELLQNGLLPVPASFNDEYGAGAAPGGEEAASPRPAPKTRKGRKKSAGQVEADSHSFGIKGGIHGEYERIRRTGDFRIRFRGRPSQLTPEVAEAKLEMLQPAAVLLAERTLQSDEHGGQHYLLVDDVEAVAIYFPTSLKSLSDEEFRGLVEKMEAMRTGADY